MRRTAPSLETFSAVIEVVHDAGVDGACWPEGLKRIAALLNSPTAALWTRDAAGRLENMASVRPDPQAAIDYARPTHVNFRASREELLSPYAVEPLEANAIAAIAHVVPADCTRASHIKFLLPAHGPLVPNGLAVNVSRRLAASLAPIQTPVEAEFMKSRLVDPGDAGLP